MSRPQTWKMNPQLLELTMTQWLMNVLLLLALCASVARAGNATTGPVVSDSFTIGGEDGWDYMTVDPDTHLLYVTRGTHLQVIDTDTNDVAADILNCGAHGIALVSDLKKGFTSDGKADTVTAFDLETRKVLYKIPTGHNPDAIIYDPASKRVFAFDGKSSDATVINPAVDASLAVVAHIPLDGKPEFAVSDGSGNVFVNIEDKNEIQDIDSKSMMVINTWKIDGVSPSGLAIDVEHQHLFAGCDGKMVVVDTTTGQTIATPPIGDGVDACAFDPDTGQAYASCGDGTLAVIKETSPGKFETVQTVQTKSSARTMALDPTTHTIYLAFAEILPKVAGERWGTIKPNTFSILVITSAK